jgi:hypothetical protein
LQQTSPWGAGVVPVGHELGPETHWLLELQTNGDGQLLVPFGQHEAPSGMQPSPHDVCPEGQPPFPHPPPPEAPSPLALPEVGSKAHNMMSATATIPRLPTMTKYPPAYEA